MLDFRNIGWNVFGGCGKLLNHANKIGTSMSKMMVCAPCLSVHSMCWVLFILRLHDLTLSLAFENCISRSKSCSPNLFIAWLEAGINETPVLKSTLQPKTSKNVCFSRNSIFCAYSWVFTSIVVMAKKVYKEMGSMHLCRVIVFSCLIWPDYQSYSQDCMLYSWVLVICFKLFLIFDVSGFNLWLTRF